MKLRTILWLTVLFTLWNCRELVAQITVNETSGCVPHVATFQSSLTGNLTWSFSNGAGSSAKKPQMAFLSAGQYSVTVSNGSSTQTLQNAVTVHPSPDPSFSISRDTACPLDSILFQVSGSAATTSVWSFDDGNTDTGAAVYHSFSQGGVYDVGVYQTNQHGCSRFELAETPIFIHEVENPTFTTNEDLFCSIPATITCLADDTTNSGAIWAIDGDSVTSGNSMTYTFSDPGNYQISLALQDSALCPLVSYRSVVVSETSSPNQSLAINESCVPFSQELPVMQGYADQEWSILSGNASLENGHVMIQSAGLVQMVMEAFDTVGCPVWDTVNVVGKQSPNPQIQISDSMICDSGYVELLNGDPGAMNVWMLNNDTLTGDTIAYFFDIQGSYDLEVRSTLENGCADTLVLTDRVRVETGSPLIDLSAMEHCVPAEFSLEHNNPWLSEAKWMIAGVDTVLGTEQTIQVNEAGSFPLLFIGESMNGCRDSVHVMDFLNTFDQDLAFSTQTIRVCPNTSVSLGGENLGYSNHFWIGSNFGTSTDSVLDLSYAEEGSYVVQYSGLTQSGCSILLDTHSLIIVAGVQGQISLDSVDCAGPNAFLSANGDNITSWSWTVGGSTYSTPSIVYPLSNAYPVNVSLSVSDSFGCTSNSYQVGMNLAAPCDTSISLGGAAEAAGVNPVGWGLSSLTPIDICGPAEVSFHAPLDTAWQVTWFIGNDSALTGDTVSYLFDSAGIYNVMVVNYHSDSGYLDTAHFPNAIRVNQPNAAFDHTQVNLCDGQGVQIEDQGSPAQVWNTWFGDGHTSTEKNAQHFYDSAGYYSITRMITDSIGCVASSAATVTIGHPFIQENIANEICGLDSLQIWHNIHGYASYQWTVGGQTYNDKFPMISFGSSSQLEVLLTVFDSANCARSFFEDDSILVYNPVARFELPSAFSGCGSLRDVLENTSVASSQFKWYIDSAYTSNAVDLSVDLTEGGGYHVRLRAQKGGCTSDTVQTIQIHHAIADFDYSLSSFCAPAILTLTDQSVQPVLWEWQVGADSLLTSQNPSIDITSIEHDSIVLSIIDSAGCEAYSSKVFPDILRANPLSLNEVNCLPDVLTLVDATENDSIHEWSIGGALHWSDTVVIEVDSQLLIDHTAWHASGCSVTVNLDSITEVTLPNAQFSISGPSNICAPFLVEFTDESSNASSWKWYFGDGSTSILPSPSHIYFQPGKYLPYLITSNVHGCRDTFYLEDSLIVHGPTADLSYSPSILCTGQDVIFTNKSLDYSQSYWSFGDGISSQEDSPIHIFEDSGSVDLALIVLDSHGCQDYKLEQGLSVGITPMPIVSLVQSSRCLPSQIDVFDESKGLDDPTFTWQIDSVNWSWLHDSAITLQTSGTHTLKYVVTNANGCSADTTIQEDFIVYDTVANSTATLTALTVEQEGARVEYELDRSDNFKGSVLNAQMNGVFLPVDSTTESSIGYVNNSNTGKEGPSCFTIDLDHYCVADGRQEAPIHCTVHLETESVENGNILTWTALKNAEFSNYSLYASRAENGNYRKLIGSFAKEILSAHDSSEYCPGEVDYVIEATRLGGREVSSSSNIAKAVIDTLNYLLEPVNIDKVSVLDDERVIVQWDDVPTGELLTGINLFRLIDGDWEVYKYLPLQTRIFVDDSVNVHQSSYEYFIVSENVCGYDQKPGHEGNSILLEVDQEGQWIDARWNAYDAWGSEVDHYELQRLDEDGNWETIEEVEPSEDIKRINLLDID